ncbi:MAG: DeoR/GlpR family DNA-binding transcription regulator [Verrucomicrobiota bacterium]
MELNGEKADLIPARRRSMILDLIRQQTAVSVHELARNVGVSLSTARRDLDELSRLGFIERSHGGAILPRALGTASEPDLGISAHFAHEEKKAIGRAAAELLRDGQTVLFDSGSTVMEVAQRVVEKGLRLTAVTNDVRMAALFSRSAPVQVVVLGGTLRPGSPTLVGEPGLSFLKSLHVDVSVIGIHAVKETRLCETTIDLAVLKRDMLKAARYGILVADAGKFDATAFCDVCDVAQVSEIVTDGRLPAPRRKELEQLGIKVRIVSGS